jgi:hypothetical protein
MLQPLVNRDKYGVMGGLPLSARRQGFWRSSAEPQQSASDAKQQRRHQKEEGKAKEEPLWRPCGDCQNPEQHGKEEKNSADTVQDLSHILVR